MGGGVARVGWQECRDVMGSYEGVREDYKFGEGEGGVLLN